MILKNKYRYLIEYFEKNMPIAESELNFENPYQLVVAVILSAQCTDKRVNLTTPALFERYPDAEALSKATVEDIYELIKSISYPNNKSKNLLGMAKVLMSDFNGIVPDDVDKLQTLPGVGRKTANVVASVAFNKPAMAVDTHVFRVSARIGLTKNAKNPLETERQLVKYIPESIIPKAHHWLILHGRYVCKARKPECEKCDINTICEYFLTKVKNS
ncbi:MAG: endonuclease III [Bacteroidales bacterium]|nr:endonuclease III [Bacteroidales bacterium]